MEVKLKHEKYFKFESKRLFQKEYMTSCIFTETKRKVGWLKFKQEKN